MIIWLNGPSGGGKSSLAAELRRALEGAVVADPEAIGDLVCGTLADHAQCPRDYQDLPAWRHLTSTSVAGLARHAGGPVIVPMTALNRTYATELLTPLRQTGAGIHYPVVHTTPKFLQERFEAGWEYHGDPERSALVRAHRRRRAADYYEAAARIRADGHVTDTSSLTPGQTLQHALARLHAGCPAVSFA